MSDIEYTEGVCDDGAAILADGRMMTISEVLETLNASDKHKVSLRLSQDSAIRLQHTVDLLRDENAKQRALIDKLVKALEPFALISTEGVVKRDAEYSTVTTVTEYFHEAAYALAAAKEITQ